MDIQENVLLAPLTTFGIGGEARFFTRATTAEAVKEALDFAKEKGLTVFILGGGSNTLFGDSGFDGLVIKIELMGGEQKGTTLIAGAGEEWDALVARAGKEKMWGIENLSAIPGTVGGAAVQNIGAYGAALSQTLAWVEVYDSAQKELRQLHARECGFGYRDSVFKQETGRYVILRVALELSLAPAPDLSYRDLAQRFKDMEPSLEDIRSAVIEIRKNKFPDLSVEGTAGSFFKNPVLSETDARALQEKYPDMPLFSLPESTGMKVPLGWILEHALNVRGLRVGSARLYEKQALVIVADRNGSAHDVAALAAQVQKKIYDAVRITIEPEVRIV